MQAFGRYALSGNDKFITDLRNRVIYGPWALNWNRAITSRWGSGFSCLTKFHPRRSGLSRLLFDWKLPGFVDIDSLSSSVKLILDAAYECAARVGLVDCVLGVAQSVEGTWPRSCQGWPCVHRLEKFRSPVYDYLTPLPRLWCRCDVPTLDLGVSLRSHLDPLLARMRHTIYYPSCLYLHADLLFSGRHVFP